MNVSNRNSVFLSRLTCVFSVRWRHTLAVVLLSGAVLLDALGSPAQASDAAAPSEPKSAEDVVQLAERFCGGCHALPSPSLLPKRSWPGVIDTMVDLAQKRIGGEAIPSEAVPHIKALYYGSSPEALPVLPTLTRSEDERQWTVQRIGGRSAVPQILNIQPVAPKDFGRRSAHAFLVCDGERKQLTLLEAEGNDRIRWRETPLATFTLPIQTRVLDYTGNGRMDIVVADLGELPPSGRLKGKLYLLAQDEAGNLDKQLLYEGLGRIADVQVLDMNDDGRLDLAVAVFGGDNLGGVLWLENRGDGRFERHDLISLSGALNVVPVDLNGNGRQDLVTLIAQEHEVVMAFINAGEGQYRPLEIARAPHPMYGFTQLQAADLDQDGRPDLIMTNGDAFDTQNDPKPYHGVQWLRNRGNLKFDYHDIGRYYGAAKATVADINGDGYQDVIASSWVNHWDDPERQSMIWYENDGKQNFRPRTLAGNHRGMVPMVVADLDGNGRMDVLSGAFRMDLLRELMTGETANPAPQSLGDEAHSRLFWFEQLSTKER
ncbi:FG-GAP-like repeat-containing protein [Marinimicrobium agarilyticum]|uniref:FG-GAP-like repeat-containing protein n=1 Tax=Marinimicrobium agarilyticum TaxID=306546 RepID=UPI000428046C|nr:FG-GAP-like repeat-containing protein [Marinimicrobium agarilyticum]